MPIAASSAAIVAAPSGGVEREKGMNALLRAVAALWVLGAGTALAGAGFWSSTGPYGGVIFDLTGEPGDASIMYATTDGGMYRSTDGGDSWQRAGNGLADGRLGQTGAVVDAERPQDIYTFDRFGRLHRSTDRAANWVATGYERAPIQLPVALVDVPATSGQLWLLLWDFGSGAGAQVPLLRSTDDGVSFAAFGSGLPVGGSMLALAFDPLDPDRMLAVHAAPTESFGVPTPMPPTIYRSTDGGANWMPVHAPADSTYVPSVYAAAISFGTGDRVYALSNNSLVRSDDRGASWTLVNDDHLINDVLAHPTIADTLYFAASSPRFSLRVSSNGGDTSSPLDTGLSPNPSYVSTLDAHPIGAQIARLHMDPDFPAIGSRLWVATHGGGLFRSTDLGSSWSASHVGMAAATIRALEVDPNPGSIASTGPFAGDSRVYAGFGDTFLSSPGLYRSNTTTGQWDTRNSALRASQIRSIAVDPTTARAGDSTSAAHVYATGGAASEAGFINGGLYKSINSGAGWTSIDAGLPTANYGGQLATRLDTVRAIVLDPRSCAAEPRPPQPACVDLPPAGVGDPAIAPLQRVYVSATGHHDNTTSPGNPQRTHRLLRSDDAGATWTALDGNPGFPSSRVFLTSNGLGDSLRIFTQVTPLPIALSPDDPDRLYVATFATIGCDNMTLGEACSSADLLAHADVPTGVFRSDDRGATWTATNSGLPRLSGGFVHAVPSALSLVMHPSDDDVLWVSIIDDVLLVADRSRPIWKTLDGGVSWSAASAGIPQGTDIRALAVDQGDGDILYAAGAGTAANPGSVFRSDDGGANWRSISIGLPAASALALEVDPHNVTVLYAGTNTGVWSIEQLPDGDGDGAPDAVEHFAPNGGDGNGDGASDAGQPHVGSTIALFGLGSAKAIEARAKGGGGYLTTEIVSGTGACAQAMDVQTRLASRYGRDHLQDRFDYRSYPRDLAQFEITDCSSAVVDLIFQDADFDSSYGWTMRFYGPAVPGKDDSMGWFDISERAGRIAPDRWRLTLDANQFGSYRPADDRILFIGGPACYDDRVFVSDFEQVSRAKPGCG